MLTRILAICLFALAARAQAQYNVVNAANYPGKDIGAQIDAAFAASGGTPAHPTQAWIVAVPSARPLTFSTPIEIPGGTSTPAVLQPVLDCQGASLTYTGTGDAILVHGANAPLTGAIRNCKILGDKPHSTRVTSLIHIRSRIGFTLSNVELENAQYCLDWENTTADGGPGYNEDDNFEHISSTGCTSHIHAHATAGGTGSFEYNRIDDWHVTLTNYNGEEHGLSLDPGTIVFDTQGAVFDFKLNTYGSSTDPTLVALIYIDSNNALFRGHINLHGENTVGIPNAYSVYVKKGLFYNEGNNLAAGTRIYTTPGEYDRYVLHPSLSYSTNDIDGVNYASIHYEGEIGAGGANQNLCKYDIAQSARFWLASYGELGAAPPNCQFQILARNTDNTNTDVYLRGTGSPEQNILYADSYTKSVGIGPGFGAGGADKAVGTGNQQPQATLDVHGAVQVAVPTFGSGGVRMIRSITPDGTMSDGFYGISKPGQLAFHYQQSFYDATLLHNVLGLDAFASAGQVHYFVYSLANTRGTPATSSERCLKGESWDDENYHYHCVATNTIKRVALESF